MSDPARIERLVARTWRRLFWPALLKSYGPLLAWVSAFAVLSFAGVFTNARPPVTAAASIVLYLGGAFLLLRAWRSWRKPTHADARARIDALDEANPASALIDRPARPNDASAALWNAHQARLRDNARKLRAPSLFQTVQSHDPLMLRFVAPLLVGAAGLYAGAGAPQRLMAMLDPDFGALVGADKLSVQAWIVPPGYTNRAPFVIENGESINAPTGSELTIRINADQRPTLVVARDDKVRRNKLKAGEDGAFEARLTLDEALTAEIHLWGRRASYDLSALADLPPLVKFSDPPSRDERDRMAFGWEASDDFGVAQLALVLSPIGDARIADAEEAIAIDLPAVEPKQADGTEALDLTRHKWAGLTVSARLRASDASGQQGWSDAIEIALPERLFLKPLAKAAAEIRFEVIREPEDYTATAPPAVEVVYDGVTETTEASRLEAAPEGVRRAAIMLDGLTYEPAGYFRDPALYLGFRQAHAILQSARGKDDADKVDSLLWAVALRAEFGDYASAAEQLARARKALERALRDGASEEEIRRLMQAFRDAVEDFLKAQLAEALKRGDVMAADQGQNSDQTVGDSDLERMLKAMEELAETGATDQARQLLADMTAMLEQMRNFQLNPNGEGGEPLEEGPMADALRELGEQLNQQRELNDDTRRSQQQGQAGESAEDLAQRQQNLLDQLGEAMTGEGEQDQPGGQAGEAQPGQDGETGVGEGVDSNRPGGNQPDSGRGLAESEQSERFQNRMADAREAQRRAAEALENGDFETALREQQRAADALGDAATELAERADELNPNGEQGQRRGQNAGGGTDILGRPLTGDGDPGDGVDVHIPDERERQRARDILNDLRRRSGERGLTPDELDYLRRLLDRF